MCHNSRMNAEQGLASCSRQGEGARLPSHSSLQVRDLLMAMHGHNHIWSTYFPPPLGQWRDGAIAMGLPAPARTARRRAFCTVWILSNRHMKVLLSGSSSFSSCFLQGGNATR